MTENYVINEIGYINGEVTVLDKDGLIHSTLLYLKREYNVRAKLLLLPEKINHEDIEEPFDCAVLIIAKKENKAEVEERVLGILPCVDGESAKTITIEFNSGDLFRRLPGVPDDDYLEPNSEKHH